ncbi:hypothetical protein [Mucilaginibacter panaciglaebae]|uniref:PH (Pleckstrin Homology) domain-containing protein n=1 Tax=Mucilaginibacter panaciglaebae TaxID=502331 RepID=A0ABP7X2E4_9SPHI
MTDIALSEFEIAEDYINVVKKRNIIVIVSLGLYWLLLCNLHSTWRVNGHPATTLQTLVMSCVQGLFYGGVVLFVMLNKTGKAYKGLKITLYEDEVVQSTAQGLMKGIRFSEIKYAVKLYSNDLIVYHTNDDSIGIPYQIERFHEVEAFLKEKAPVFVAGPYNILNRNAQPANALVFALIITVWNLSNPTAILLLGAVSIAYTWGMYLASYRKVSSYGVSVGRRFLYAPLIWSGLVIATVLFQLFIK